MSSPGSASGMTTDGLISSDPSTTSASSLDHSSTPSTIPTSTTRSPSNKRQPLTFDFIDGEEGFKILGLEREDAVSLVPVEKKIQTMLSELANSTNREREKRALNSTIVLFAHSIDTKEMTRRFQTTDPLELSSMVFSAMQANERTALSGIMKLFWRVIHDEVVAYLIQLFPVYTEISYMFDHLYLKNRQDALPHQKLPVIPLSCEAARNILGVSEAATEKDIAEKIDELLPECGENTKPSVYDLYGSILLLGSKNQNGLSIDSNLFMLPFFGLVPEYFEAILGETDLDEDTIRTVVKNATEICLVGEQFTAIARSGEPTAQFCQLFKGFDGSSMLDSDQETYSDKLGCTKAAAKHIQQAKAHSLEEMRRKRAEDQKELGKVRGILKRTEAALKRAESRLAQQKAKSKQDSSSSTQSNTPGSPSPDLSPVLLPNVPSFCRLPPPPPASPVIDFTIQRLLAENAELKRQLEEERAKNRAEGTE